MIKHLVLVGGGPNVFIHYGILKTLARKEYLNIKNIETIHATSCGSIAALILMLNPNWDDIDNYLINRPWEKLFTVKPSNLINSLKNLGVYDETIFVDIFKPFMEINDIDIDIKLKDFHDLTKIDFNMYVTKYDEIESEVINHKTHPDLKLFTAMHMTCAIPIAFKPVLYKNKLYFDGALFKNYPLKDCIESIEDIELDEIFGIRQSARHDNNKEKKDDKGEEISILDNLDLFKFLGNIITRLMYHLNKVNYKDFELKNEIEFKSYYTDFTFWKNVLTNKEKREELIKEGEKYAEDFLLSSKNSNK